MKTAKLIGLLIPFTCGMVFSMGWRGSPEPQVKSVLDQPYEMSREKPFSGTILRIDPPPCVATPLYSYHIIVQLEKEIVEVHLAPCGYVEGRAPVLKAGDAILGLAVESATQAGPRRVFLAREVRKGKEVLHLRDAVGKPLWK